MATFGGLKARGHPVGATGVYQVKYAGQICWSNLLVKYMGKSTGQICGSNILVKYWRHTVGLTGMYQVECWSNILVKFNCQIYMVKFSGQWILWAPVWATGVPVAAHVP